MLPLDPTQATRTHVHQAEANATPVYTTGDARVPNMQMVCVPGASSHNPRHAGDKIMQMIVVDDKNSAGKSNTRAPAAPAKHFALTGNSSLDAWSSTSMSGLQRNAHDEAPSSTESKGAVPVHTFASRPSPSRNTSNI